MAKIIFKSIESKFYDLEARPYPAYGSIPDWWRSMGGMTKNPEREKSPEGQHPTAKKCFPILDGLTAGYIIPLTTDVMVRKNFDDETTTMTWRPSDPPIEFWARDVSHGFEVPSNHHNQVYKLLAKWTIKTPKGYSCLFVHPFGYPNAPFKSIAGIVDTDELETDINCPFTLDKEFEGILPAGTPMVQVIPFKRDDWQAEFRKGTIEEFTTKHNALFTKFWNAYGDKVHKKKRYR